MLFDMLFSWISGGEFGNLYALICKSAGLSGNGANAMFVLCVALCIGIPYLLGSINTSIILSKAVFQPEYIPYVRKVSIVPIILVVILGVVLGVGYLTSSVFFRAEAFSKLLYRRGAQGYRKSYQGRRKRYYLLHL